MDIVDLMNNIVIEQCYGCSVDHPIEVQHPCIMDFLNARWDVFRTDFRESGEGVCNEEMAKGNRHTIWISEDIERADDFTWIKRETFTHTESWKEDIYKLCKKWWN